MLVLLEHGATVTLIDNLSNSFVRVFEHMKKLAGDKADRMKFIKVRGAWWWWSCARWGLLARTHSAGGYSATRARVRPQCDINDYDLLTKLFAEEK